MPQSHSKIILHIVFSTNNQELWINKVFRPHLHAYLRSVCRANKSEVFRIGGTANHVHIACALPRTLTVSRLVEELKRSSVKWLKSQAPALADFAWQVEYGAFSVGQAELRALLDYIDNQGEYHRQTRFKDEYVDLLDKHGVEYDKRDLWY